MPDFIASIERDKAPPLAEVRVSLHESEYGAWRGYFFCGPREKFAVGEIIRVVLLGARARTAVVYGVEALAGRQMWVVDLVGADPPAKADSPERAAARSPAYGPERTAQK